ncbi:hypothetical protein [Pseudosulfitobacter pseudonitzschiae]|uniref:hypothetical protein n=1 Tax=Pseudosulfitobacter pseudonitzschiae TaxID=1402135 RepID=UPI003B78337F
MKKSITYCATHIELFARYRNICQIARVHREDPFGHDVRLSLENLVWMCTQCISNIATWPDDKTGRWLGFVQGCLAMRGLIDVDRERDITRPMFHAILAEKGIIAPEKTER